ncbi:hypothetical protein J6590_000775 [Homalodisca vitripennis]|nr:hypothetical protein J6590_000775 [Homalodisca vitripennis]
MDFRDGRISDILETDNDVVPTSVLYPPILTRPLFFTINLQVLRPIREVEHRTKPGPRGRQHRYSEAGYPEAHDPWDYRHRRHEHSRTRVYSHVLFIYFVLNVH